MDKNLEKVASFLETVGKLEVTHIDKLNEMVNNYIKDNNIELPEESSLAHLTVKPEEAIQSRMSLITKMCARKEKKCLLLVEGEEPAYCLVGDNPHKGKENGAAMALADMVTDAIRKSDDNVLIHGVQMAGYRLIKDVTRNANINSHAKELAKLAKEKGHEVVLVVNGMARTMTLDQMENDLGIK